MKYQNSISNVDRDITVKVFTAAILMVSFGLTMAACSNSTVPPEINRESTNTSTPISTPNELSAESDDLAGTYSVSGAGADGNTYQGDVVITKRNEVYQMSWKIGAESYDGVAVHKENTLAAAYTTGTDGKGCGAVVYKINEDDSLEGKWGEWGVNSSGTEKAVPAGDLINAVGTLDVSGTNADGSPYKGTLTVTKGDNDVFQFAWDTGTKFIGTGVRMGKYLAAGSGAKQCGFVIYEVKGDKLEGKWGVPGSTALGTETATKN